MLLSAYLITLNESEHLAEVLERLQGVDEIVVVDSGSTDGTQDIARRFGACVVHQDWLGFARQKAHAMSLCQGEWVLSMDGDEVLQLGAIDHIRTLIASTPMNGFTIPRHEVFMGRPMTRSRPDQMMRLYRKDKAEWDLVRLVHEHVEVQQPTGRIGPHMIHYGNDTVSKALGDGHGVIRAAAVHHQQLVGKRGALQAGFNAVRLIEGQHRHGQRGRRRCAACCNWHQPIHRSVASVHMLSGLQPVHRAAIGALALAGVGHIQVHLGVAVPQLHAGLGAGAEDAALGIQVFGQEFYGSL